MLEMRVSWVGVEVLDEVAREGVVGDRSRRGALKENEVKFAGEATFWVAFFFFLFSSAERLEAICFYSRFVTA